MEREGIRGDQVHRARRYAADGPVGDHAGGRRLVHGELHRSRQKRHLADRLDDGRGESRRQPRQGGHEVAIRGAAAGLDEYVLLVGVLGPHPLQGLVQGRARPSWPARRPPRPARTWSMASMRSRGCQPHQRPEVGGADRPVGVSVVKSSRRDDRSGGSGVRRRQRMAAAAATTKVSRTHRPSTSQVCATTPTTSASFRIP